MEVTKVYTESKNKWAITVEGIEKGREVKTFIAIPPTTGDRLDIILGSDLKEGYRYDIDGIIIIHILNGFPHVRYYKKGVPF